MARRRTSKQYTYQEFLLHCSYDQIQIEDFRRSDLHHLQDIDQGYNLFDYAEGVVRRSIPLSQLDRIIDDENDLKQFIESIRWVEELVIINDRPIFENTILSTYSENTIRAYLYHLTNADVRCFII